MANVSAVFAGLLNVMMDNFGSLDQLVQGPPCNTSATNSTSINSPLSDQEPRKFPLDYRIIATVAQSIIFVIGFFGNIMICVVVRKTRTLHTPTYCYLVSLAAADSIMICTCLPDILSHHLYAKQWVLGSASCSLNVFLAFLSINAGSLSIVAFTVERYIAICHPMKAHKLCSVTRARRIIVLAWLVVGIYSSPWLFLAGTQNLKYTRYPDMVYCGYHLLREQYLGFYMTDLVTFYIVPLLIAVILYTRMGFALYRSIRAMRSSSNRKFSQHSISAHNGWTTQKSQRYFTSRRDMDTSDSMEGSCLNGSSNGSSVHQQDKLQSAVMKSRCQVVKMLVIVVVCFALLWAPYRGVLVYNSISGEKYLNKWYMMFAKTLVYLNSAINPFLYTVLSRKFRSAFFRIICCWKENLKPRKSKMTHSMTEMSLRAASGALHMSSGVTFQSLTLQEKIRPRGPSSPQTPTKP